MEEQLTSVGLLSSRQKLSILPMPHPNRQKLSVKAAVSLCTKVWGQADT
jgi:hypothetical protein